MTFSLSVKLFYITPIEISFVALKKVNNLGGNAGKITVLKPHRMVY